MAENKKSFLLYADFLTLFEELTDEEAGKLVKHVFRYVNDLEPEAPDRLTKIAFEPIKQQLKRDLGKWDIIRGKRSEAGKASAEARKNTKQNQQMSTHVESVKQTSTNPTVNVNGNVNVNATGNVNEAVINKEIKDFLFDELLANDIMSFFSFTQFANADKWREILNFQRCLFLNDKLEYFKIQWKAYSEFKKLAPQYKHAFTKFIGVQSELYLKGMWNEENWVQKLKDEKNGKKTTAGARAAGHVETGNKLTPI